MLGVLKYTKEDLMNLVGVAIQLRASLNMEETTIALTLFWSFPRDANHNLQVVASHMDQLYARVQLLNRMLTDKMDILSTKMESMIWLLSKAEKDLEATNFSN